MNVKYQSLKLNMKENNHTVWLYIIILILLMVSYDQSSHKTLNLDPETKEEFYFHHPVCNCYR